MPWWGYAVTAVGSGFILSFWGWIAASIVKLQKEIAVIKRDIAMRDKECEARLIWLRDMDKKLDTIGEDTAKIKGMLER